MTNINKIQSILIGIIMIITAVTMIIYPKDSYVFIILFLSLGLFFSSIKTLIYYFTMAKYMVGGKISLYKGVLLFNFAFLTGSFTDVPRAYILLYLAMMHAFAGIIEILRAREVKKYNTLNWIINFVHGVISITIALCCIIFIRKTNTAVIIYSVGLIYSALNYIAAGLKKSTLVYIQ